MELATAVIDAFAGLSKCDAADAGWALETFRFRLDVHDSGAHGLSLSVYRIKGERNQARLRPTGLPRQADRGVGCRPGGLPHWIRRGLQLWYVPSYLPGRRAVVTKFRSTEGKMPRTRVPSAETHRAVVTPMLGGWIVAVASPGSRIYITTRMRR